MASIRGILNIQAREFNFLQRGKFHIGVLDFCRFRHAPRGRGRGGNLLWPVEDFQTPCGGTGRPALYVS